MTNSPRGALFIILALLTGPLATAQTTSGPFAVVLHASGSELGIFRSGEIHTYDLRRQNVVGLPILEGDLIQTERSTFIEVQLFPSRTILKIAENTSFQVQTFGTDGNTSFQLLYGRVRAQVDRVSADDSFQIRGRTAVAGVRGTDFGFDYVVQQGNITDPITQVYCFEGSVEVVSGTGTSPAPGVGAANLELPQPVLIVANQMVTLKEAQPAPVTDPETSAEVPPVEGIALQTASVSREIDQYWKSNDFQSQAVDIDEIDRKFPLLKVQILEARRQAQLIAEQKALQAGLRTLPEFQQRVEALQLPQPSYADTLAAFEPVNATNLIRESQPQVYVVNGQRTFGTFLTGTGSFLGLGAVSVIAFGESVYGLEPQSVLPVAIGLGIAGAVSLAIGLPLYLGSIPSN